MEPVPRLWQLFLPSSCPCVSSLKQQWEPEEFKTLLLCGFMAWLWFKPSFLPWIAGWEQENSQVLIWITHALPFQGVFPPKHRSVSSCCSSLSIFPCWWELGALLTVIPSNTSLQKSFLIFGAVRGGWKVAAAWWWTDSQLISWYCRLEGDFFPLISVMNNSRKVWLNSSSH